MLLPSTETLISEAHASDCRCCRALALALANAEYDCNAKDAEIDRLRACVAALTDRCDTLQLVLDNQSRRLAWTDDEAVMA